MTRMKPSLLIWVLLGLIAGPTPNASAKETEPKSAPKAHKAHTTTQAGLTTEETEVYQYGEISDASLVGGGLIGIAVHHRHNAHGFIYVLEGTNRPIVGLTLKLQRACLVA